MAEQLVRDYRRAMRMVLVALAIVQLLAAGVALWLVSSDRAPVLAAATQRVLAYAWVAVTIAGAVGAYGIARTAVESRTTHRLGAVIAAAAVADLAAFAGIVVFCLVGVWPMLLVALLVGALGLVLGWPRESGYRGAESGARPADVDALR